MNTNFSNTDPNLYRIDHSIILHGLSCIMRIVEHDYKIQQIMRECSVRCTLMHGPFT